MSGVRTRARTARAAVAQLDLFAGPPGLVAVTRHPRPVLVVPVSDPDAGRWRWTRPWLASPHRARARRELEVVRAHFPELDGTAITVGLTRRRGVLGLASLGELPAIWIRARRIHRFALAHELVHLLQARGLVAGGEKAADLYALARSPALVDVVPFYLRLPRGLGGPAGTLDPAVAVALHALAMRALAEHRGKSARGAVRAFERAAATLGP